MELQRARKSLSKKISKKPKVKIKKSKPKKYVQRTSSAVFATIAVHRRKPRHVGLMERCQHRV